MFIKICCEAIITWIFIICFRIYRFYESFKDISASKNIKVFIRYFLSVRNFAKKFSSSSCGSFLGVELFIIFFSDLRMPLVLTECFDLLSSVYNEILFDFEYSVFQVTP